MSAREDLRQRIDFLEETYEFLLSYAARGLTGGEGSDGQVRDYLDDSVKITGELAGLYREAVDELAPDDRDPYDSYADVVEADASATRAALQLVLAQPGIGSQLVDNLNASTHFRALLTDLFLVDELVKPQRVKAGASGKASD